MTKKLEEASVHGRFQVFHMGHLEYLKAAKRKSKFLWIGIAGGINQSAAPLANPLAPHRFESVHNPLTYFERMEMITATLLDEGFKRSQFAFVPFPIDFPSLLPNYLPVRIPCFTTVYDEWNRHKANELRRIGYEVIVLWERTEKKYVGSEIRELIKKKDSNWKTLVPRGVAKYVEGINLAERLERLSKTTAD